MIFVDQNNKSVFVSLDKNDIEFCKKLAEKRSKYKIWGDKATPKNKAWDKGFLNSKKDSSRTERVGLYGEKAFSILTGLPVDETVSKKGDKGWDFEIVVNKQNIKIDVKTSLKEIWRENIDSRLYMRADDRRGKLKVLKANYYFLTSVIYYDSILFKDKKTTDINADNLIIEMHGVITKEDILRKKEERIGGPATKNKNANWKNYYIEREELVSPIEFLELYQSSFNFINAGVFA